MAIPLSRSCWAIGTFDMSTSIHLALAVKLTCSASCAINHVYLQLLFIRQRWTVIAQASNYAGKSAIVPVIEMLIRTSSLFR